MLILTTKLQSYYDFISTIIMISILVKEKKNSLTEKKIKKCYDIYDVKKKQAALLTWHEKWYLNSTFVVYLMGTEHSNSSSELPFWH